MNVVVPCKKVFKRAPNHFQGCWMWRGILLPNVFGDAFSSAQSTRLEARALRPHAALDVLEYPAVCRLPVCCGALQRFRRNTFFCCFWDPVPTPYQPFPTRKLARFALSQTGGSTRFVGFYRNGVNKIFFSHPPPSSSFGVVASEFAVSSLDVSGSCPPANGLAAYLQPAQPRVVLCWPGSQVRRTQFYCTKKHRVIILHVKRVVKSECHSCVSERGQPARR